MTYLCEQRSDENEENVVTEQEAKEHSAGLKQDGKNVETEYAEK